MTNAMLKTIEEERQASVWSDEELAKFEKDIDFAIHNNRLEGGIMDANYKEKAMALLKKCRSIEEYQKKCRENRYKRLGMLDEQSYI